MQRSEIITAIAARQLLRALVGLPKMDFYSIVELIARTLDKATVEIFRYVSETDYAIAKSQVSGQ